MLKKIVIADNLKPVVNELFADPSQHTGGTLIFGAVLFSLQIYGDFSGYSDIARGVSKLFGIELLVNFKQPYLSRNIPEFWRRWHISLSSWFRDYIYIPLGGSRTSMAKAIRNVFVIFIVSGFWHGANWTFIIWGAIHALLFIPSFIRKANRNALGDEFETGSWYPSPRELTGIVVTFALVTLAWVFFRADSISQAFSYLGYMADQPLRFNFSMFRHVILLLPFSFMLDILQRNDYLLQKKRTWYIAMESAVLVAIILVFGNFGGSEFIYFQF
jgi:D-alanyl-lipoteichoic acid acyltransferase DltB (MBOAT superfamily)